MSLKQYMLFIVILFCSYLMGNAQVDSLLKNELLNEITINAPIYIKHVKKWPGAVSVVDSAQIRSGNSYQLSEQLNTMPGIYMQQGTMSTNRITIRGVGSRTPYESNRIKAYWGEIPLTNGDGVTAIEDISLNDMQSIQILKGPGSSLYGAGLGGVILINPWEGIVSQNKYSFQTEVGSFATLSNQMNVELKKVNSSIYSISASQLHTDGYRDNSEYDRYNFTFKARHNIGESYLFLVYNFRHLFGQIPSSIDSVNYHNNPQSAAASWKAIGGYEESNRHLINIGWSAPVAVKSSNTINIFYNYSDVNELRPFNQLDEARSAIGIRNKFTKDFSNIRFDIGFETMSEQNNLAYYGVRTEDLNQLLNENKINRSYLNVFTLIDYQPTKRWNFQFAVNVNRTFYKADYNTDETKEKYKYSWVLSPRLGVNYQIKSNMYLFTSLGHGFSNPSVEESQMPDGSFNNQIRPEEGVSLDLGYRFVSQNANTTFETTFYYMWLSNLLVTKRESDDVFYGINAGKTKHQGMEVLLSHMFFKVENTTALDLNISGFMSENRFRNFIDDGNDYQDNFLPGIPDYMLAFNGHYYIHPFNISFNYKVIGEQYLNDANTKIYNGYNKVGAKLSMDLNMSKFRSTIYCGVDNLFNTHYASMVLINAPSFGNNSPRYYYPGLPFSVYGGLSVRF